MLEGADIVRRYGDAYLARFGHALLPGHRRAMRDKPDGLDAVRVSHLVYGAESRRLRSSRGFAADNRIRRSRLLDAQQIRNPVFVTAAQSKAAFDSQIKIEGVFPFWRK